MSKSFTTDNERIGRFMQWLRENGATFPKIDFPRNDTPSGIRGAIAIEDIATNEHMLTIPYHVMMAPPQILAHQVLGPILRQASDLLKGDFLMTVYLMHEMRLGEKSFYKPYIDILPIPENVSEWTDRELLELQDERFFLRTKNRQMYLERAYYRVVHGLHLIAPDIFPLEEFPYESFAFAFNCIQARAFGRRLPWTALVPFADCLNHSNVQTKYDFIDLQVPSSNSLPGAAGMAKANSEEFDVTENDSDPSSAVPEEIKDEEEVFHDANNGESSAKTKAVSNIVFRLFPTGRNHYPAGSEVYNSYGRRENENLLMDYGFAMLDNRWDEVDIKMSLTRDMCTSDFVYNRKRAKLATSNFYGSETFTISYHGGISLDALRYARVLMQEEGESEVQESGVCDGEGTEVDGRFEKAEESQRWSRYLSKGPAVAAAVTDDGQKVNGSTPDITLHASAPLSSSISIAPTTPVEDELRALEYLLSTLVRILARDFATTAAEDERLLEILLKQFRSTADDSVDKVAEGMSSLHLENVDVENDDTVDAADLMRRVRRDLGTDSVSAHEVFAEGQGSNSEVGAAIQANKVRRGFLMNSVHYRLTRKRILYQHISSIEAISDFIALYQERSIEENDRVFKQLLAQFVENEGSQIYLVQRKRDRLQAYLYWLRDDLLKLTSP